MKYTVAVVDDHHLIRAGLVTMIDNIPNFKVICEASNGKEFIEMLENIKQPKITVMDLHMPIMGGLETIADITKRYPEILVLVLTLDDTEESLVKSIRAGARGFIKKNAKPGILEKALNSLSLTGYYHTDEMHKAMIGNPHLKTKHERKREDVIKEITPRESEFLTWVCDSNELTYEQIADKMSITVRTVDHFRKELFEKFHIKSKAGLVLFAVKWNLIEF